MKIEGSQLIQAPRAQLYQMLIDPVVLQRCVPGCEALNADEDGSYKMVLKAGVGSIKGTFNGKIRLAELREPEHYQMIVEGSGKVGFVKGTGALDLTEQDGGTLVKYAGDINVGGTIASVGQRMVVASAQMMAKQFFKAIEAEANTDGETKPSFVRRLLNRVAGSDEATTTNGDGETPPSETSAPPGEMS